MNLDLCRLCHIVFISVMLLRIRFCYGMAFIPGVALKTLAFSSFSHVLERTAHRRKGWLLFFKYRYEFFLLVPCGRDAFFSRTPASTWCQQFQVWESSASDILKRSWGRVFRKPIFQLPTPPTFPIFFV